MPPLAEQTAHRVTGPCVTQDTELTICRSPRKRRARVSGLEDASLCVRYRLVSLVLTPQLLESHLFKHRSSSLKKNRYFFPGKWPLELPTTDDQRSLCSRAHRMFVHLHLSLGPGGWAAVSLQTPRAHRWCRKARRCQEPHCLQWLSNIESQLLRCPSPCFLMPPDDQKEPSTWATALSFLPCLVLPPESLWCYKKTELLSSLLLPGTSFLFFKSLMTKAWFLFYFHRENIFLH